MFMAMFIVKQVDTVNTAKNLTTLVTACPWKLHSLPCQIAWAQGCGTSKKADTVAVSKTLQNIITHHNTTSNMMSFKSNMIRSKDWIMLEAKSLGCLNKYVELGTCRRF